MAGGEAIAAVQEVIDWQVEHTARAGAPRTARVVAAARAVLDTGTMLGTRMREWPHPSTEDALPLRFAAGLHNLHLTGNAPELAAVYAGELTDQVAVDRIVCALVERFDAHLVPWLDGPPQTNEAGRGASIVAGLLWLAQRFARAFELNEIGASAGVNTMLERYRFDLGGVTVGPSASPMQIAPAWNGPPPPPGPLSIITIRGSDIAPVDLADPAQALRLKSYVWADATERMARIDAAIALAAERRPDLVQADAGQWVADLLTTAQPSGVTRVLYHSIMWQYLPAQTRTAITAAMERAGQGATPERPLAWLALETNRETFRHELTVRYWPGGAAPIVLAEAHPHGAWITWRAHG